VRRFAFVALVCTVTVASGPVRSVRVGTPVPVAGSHGDTWVAAWAKDGSLYSPSDDSEGFHRAGSANIVFNRIDGEDPLKLSGITVNPMKHYGKLGERGPDHCTWKSSGCYFVDGVAYWVVARHKYGEDSGDPRRRQTAQNASIIKSADFGGSWVRSAEENYAKPMFPGSRFATPYFIEYGRDGQATVDNAGQYVYAISNNGFWDNGDNLILGRVRRDRIAALRAADWEFYAGGDGLRDSAWSHDMKRAFLVLDAPGKLGMNGAVWVPALGRYVMIGWYYPAGGGKIPGASKETNWDFYEASKPWGPWSKVASYHSTPQGYYSPQLCPKFQSEDRSYLLTAGDWNVPDYYRLTVFPADLH
jgi:hypothetical protein